MDRPTMTLVAATYAGVVGLLALASAVAEVPAFFDPCHSWGIGSSGTLSPDASCPSRSGTSETMGEAIARLILIQGAALAAAVMAILGTIRVDGRWLAVAGFVYGALVVPLGLGGAWIVVLPASVLCFIAARATWPQQPQVPASA